MSAARWRERLPVTVLRPSIIVGERDSGWTTSFNVLYWPLRAFSRGTYIALPARGDAPVDVVPVDYVADAIFALSQAPEAEGATYHLTAGADASSVGELVELASALLQTSGAAPDRPCAVSPRGAPAASSRHAAMSATAERCHAARSSSPTSRCGSPTTIVAPVWRCVGAGSGPRRCAPTSTGWSSSRSPPSGGGGRYRARASPPLRAVSALRTAGPGQTNATRPAAGGSRVRQPAGSAEPRGRQAGAGQAGSAPR